MTQPNIFISCKESRIESNRSFYGCYNLGPFESGLSLTVANALRRTLLSECTGLGIVSVTIENVTHEYSTLPGVRESVLDLLLNLKEIVFKKRNKAYSLYKKKSMIYNQIGTSYLKPVSGFLKVKGPGVIRARDLKLPPFVECADPEQYIATLADDGFLCMKFIIMEGKGYLIPSLTSEGSSNSNLSSSSSSSSSFLNKKQNEFNVLALRSAPLQRSKESPKEKRVRGGEKQDENSALSFIDTKLVKKRLNFLNEIKNFLPPTFPSVSLRETEGSSRGAKQLSFESQNQGFMNKQTRVVLSQNKNKNMNSSITYNNSSINLDTVFNPVTKVSYIIEDFENKIVDDSNKKVNFVNDVSSLIESSHYLKTNLPFLTKEIALNQTEISKFVDTYSTFEIQKLSSYLHPLKKQSSLNSITLEIWTNGSLHPRDALYMAFEKLASVFLSMEKTQCYNSIFVNESSMLIASQHNSILVKQASLSFPYGEREQGLCFAHGEKEATSFGLQSKEQQEAEKQEQTLKLNELQKYNIDFLNISLRPYTLLKRSNVNTVFDLCQLTIDDLKYICGFNPKYVNNVANILTKNGLSLKKES